MSLESNREALEGLEPRSVWGNFAKLSQIPRASKEEAQAREYIAAWAEEKGYQYQIDSVGNLLVRVPGRREGKPLLLQGHIDMVCVPGKEDPISPALVGVELELGEDGWLRSKGGKTSVGADNGVGSSTMMALADEPDLQYPPLELLFTIDEEDGLEGVSGLDLSMISADRMLNMDSEDGYNVSGIASAGGRGFKATIDPERSPLQTTASERLLVMKAEGFQGGHSGLEINKGQGNPIKVLADTLNRGNVDSHEFDVFSMEGGSGSRGNVIPSSAQMQLKIPAQNAEAILNRLAIGAEAALKGINNPGTIDINVSSRTVDPSSRIFSTEAKYATLGAISALPDGVLTRRTIPLGAPDVSSNFGYLRTGDQLEAVTCVRGHTVHDLDDQFAESKAIFASRGFSNEDLFSYGGWEVDQNSTILAQAEAVLKASGIEPERLAYHCGLEVGDLCQRMTEIGRPMDAIATGPTIREVHGINERIDVESVAQWYNHLKRLLATV